VVSSARLTVAALAPAAKVDPDRIAAIEAGQHDPDFDRLVALAEGLDEPRDAPTACRGRRAPAASGSTAPFYDASSSPRDKG
jgi:hypothetical protein